MTKVTDVKVIEAAASQELALARRRIGELEGKVALYTGRAGLARRAVGWLLLLALVAVLLVGAASAVHRLLLWGWP